MLFVLGIDHIQHQTAGGELAFLLKNKLQEIIKQEQVHFVAEEICQQAFDDGVFKGLPKKETIAQDWCKKKGVKHLMVDPDKSKRYELGIALREDVAKQLGFDVPFDCLLQSEIDVINNHMKEDDQKREKYWLKCIESKMHQNGVMVCGFDHLSSFCLLVSKSGYVVKNLGGLSLS